MPLKSGLCISDGGVKRFRWITIEINKRDQYKYGMHILSHWTGYGIIEVLENYLASFNESLFKKEVTPLKKWEWMEGLVTWLKVGEGVNFVQALFKCSARDKTKDIFSISIPMYIISLELLSEHNLIDAPHSPAFNIPTITILLVEFLQYKAADFHIKNVHEIIRSADKHGVHLKKIDGIMVSEEDIEQLKSEVGGWAEFDWNKIWKKFSTQQGHKGGQEYDITLISREKAKKYRTSY